MPQWSAGELNERLQAERDLLILDVRQPGEWQAGHIPGARHIPGGELPRRIEEIPRDKPVAVYCGIGGFSAWRSRQLPVDK